MSYTGKSIGVSNLTFFPIKSDTENGTTVYDTPIRVCRTITLDMEPIIANAVLDSDDGVEDDLSMMQAITVSFSGNQILDEVRSKIFGHTYTDGRTDKKGDQPVLGALAFKTLLSTEGGAGQKYAYVVLYKGRLAEFKEHFETLKKDGITFQTHNDIVGSFAARESDGKIRYVIREDDANFPAAKAAAWFESPQVAAEENSKNA